MGRAVIWTAICLGLGGWRLALHAQAPRGGIEGRVLDRTTGQPVAEAEVTLLGQARGPVRSDRQGRFQHAALRAGMYLVEVRRMGYQPRTWEVAVPEQEVAKVVFELEPAPAVLPPVTVEGQLDTWLKSFEERRALGRGQFITRQDIERRGAPTLGDLLRTVNGLRTYCDRNGICAIRMTRWINCIPEYFQDGIPVFAATAERYFVGDIYGIEIYNLSEVPTEFQRTNLKCGVIAIWTRRGPRR
jgi:hypothetical protein